MEEDVRGKNRSDAVIGEEKESKLTTPVVAVLETTKLNDSCQSESGFHVGVGQLLLDKLERSDGDSELLAEREGGNVSNEF